MLANTDRYVTLAKSLKHQLAEAGFTPKDINYLALSHYHWDHTDGNEWMHSEGATILAHENTRKHLSTTTRVEGWDFTFPPSPAGAIRCMRSRRPP